MEKVRVIGGGFENCRHAIAQWEESIESHCFMPGREQ